MAEQLTPVEAVDTFAERQRLHDAVHMPQLPAETSEDYRQRVLGGAIASLNAQYVELTKQPGEQ